MFGPQDTRLDRLLPGLLLALALLAAPPSRAHAQPVGTGNAPPQAAGIQGMLSNIPVLGPLLGQLLGQGGNGGPGGLLSSLTGGGNGGPGGLLSSLTGGGNGGPGGLLSSLTGGGSGGPGGLLSRLTGGGNGGPGNLISSLTNGAGNPAANGNIQLSMEAVAGDRTLAYRPPEDPQAGSGQEGSEPGLGAYGGV